MAEARLPERRFVEVVLLWCNSTTTPPRDALEFVLRAAAPESAEDELVKTIKSAVEDLGADPTEDARAEALEKIKDWIVVMNYDGGEERGRAARKRAREEVDDPIPSSSPYQEFKRRRTKIAGSFAFDRSLDDIDSMGSLAIAVDEFKAAFGEDCFEKFERLCPMAVGEFKEAFGEDCFEKFKRLCPRIFAPSQSQGTAFEAPRSRSKSPRDRRSRSRSCDRQRPPAVDWNAGFADGGFCPHQQWKKARSRRTDRFLHDEAMDHRENRATYMRMNAEEKLTYGPSE